MYLVILLTKCLLIFFFFYIKKKVLTYFKCVSFIGKNEINFVKYRIKKKNQSQLVWDKRGKVNGSREFLKLIRKRHVASSKCNVEPSLGS